MKRPSLYKWLLAPFWWPWQRELSSWLSYKADLLEARRMVDDHQQQV